MTVAHPDQMTSHENHAAGAIYGALIGDAAGGVLEFMGRPPTKAEATRAIGMPGGGVFGLAPGQFTDDGEMTVTLLAALAQHKGAFVGNSVAAAYNNWAHSNPFDIGMATRSALFVRESGLQDVGSLAALIKEQAKALNHGSKANGSLMRATPLGIAACPCSMSEILAMVREDVEFTHPNAACVASTTAYVLAVRHLILFPKDNRGAEDAAREYLTEANAEVLQWLEDAVAGNLPAAYPQAGFVRYGFTYAFHFLHHAYRFRDAIHETLLMGGDTDTNACIVGGLLGAYNGFSALPKASLDGLLACDTKLGQDRPSQYRIGSVSANLSLVNKYCAPRE